MAELQIGIDPSGAKKGSDEAKAALKSIADSAAAAVSALDRFGPASSSAISSLLGLLNPLNLIKGAWGMFETGASVILGLLNPLNLINAAMSAVSGAWNLFTSALSAGYSIISGVASLFANMTITLEGIGSAAMTVASAIGTTLVTAIQSTYDAFAQATNVAGSFEQSMANVKSMGVENEAQFQAMRAAAIQLGADTSLSSSQAAEALYNLRSAGLSSAESVAALEGAGKLAEATMAPLGMTAETVASTLRQFGMDAAKAGDVSNVFAAAIQNSALTMPRIADAMKYAGTTAGALGISLQETTAALMVLNNAGIRGEQSGTVLRSALAALVDPSKQSADAIKALGLNIDQVNPSVVGIKGVIDTLARSGADTTAIMKIFGVEAGPGMAALVKAGSGAIDEFQRKITGTNATMEMSKAQLDTYSGALKIYEGSWESLQIVIGDIFLPVLKNVYLGLSEGVNAITAWMQSTGVAQAATAALNGVLDGARLILEGFGTAAGTVSPLLQTIGTTLGTLLTQFGTFATNVGAAVASSQAFQVGVTAIATAAQALMAPFTSAATAADQFGKAITAANPAGSLFQSVVSGLATALGGAAQSVAAWLTSLQPMAVAFAQGVKDGTLLRGTLDVLATAWTTLTTTVGNVSSVLATAWNLFSTGVEAVSSIAPALGGAVDAMGQFVAFTETGIKVDWGGLFKVGVDQAVEALKALPAAASEVAMLIGPALSEPLSKLAPDFSAALAQNDWASVWGILSAAIPDAIGKAVEAITTGVSQIWAKIQGPFGQIFDQMKTTAMAKLQQMNDEISTKYGVDIGGLLKTFGSVATGVKAGVDAVADAGTFYGSLVGEFETNSKGLEDAMTTPWTRAAAAISENQISFGTAMGGYTTAADAAGVNAANAYVNGFTTTFNGGSVAIDNAVKSSSGDVFEKYPAAAYDWGGSVATSYDQGFGDSLSAATAQAGALADWATTIEAHSPPKVGPLKDVDKWGQSIAEAFSSSFVAYMGGTGTDSVAASIDLMSKTAFGILDQNIAAIQAKSQGLNPTMASRGPLEFTSTGSSGGASMMPTTPGTTTSTRTVNTNNATTIAVNMQDMSPSRMAQMLNLELAKRGR